MKLDKLTVKFYEGASPAVREILSDPDDKDGISIIEGIN